MNHMDNKSLRIFRF